MDLVERQKNAKFVDKSGHVNSYGVRVISYAGDGVKRDGSVGTIAVWVCECPSCKNQFNVWGTLLNRCRSCSKCKRHYRKKEDSQLRFFWRDKINRTRKTGLSQFVPEWHDCDTFVEWLKTTEWVIRDDKGDLCMPAHHTIMPVDSTQPTGPNNVHLVRSSSEHPRRQKTELFDYQGQKLSRGEIAQLFGISRQAVHAMSTERVIDRLRIFEATKSR